MSYEYCPHYPEKTDILRYIRTDTEYGDIAEIDCHECGITYVQDSGDGMDTDIALSIFEKGILNPKDPNGLQWVLKE